MFSSEVITFFFISVIASFHILKLLDKFGAVTLTKIILAFACLSSIYCLLAGLFLLTGWQDPLSATSAESLANTHSRYKALLFVAIKYWPYFLIILGVGSTFTYSRTLLGLLKRSRINA
ncbi:MAG: hypothetical protein H7Z20_02735 [Bdellovibrio sp.]|nr:hypothetical protein [Methylotenera sp.]